MHNFEEIIKVTKHLRLLYVEDNKDVMKSTFHFLQDFFDNIIVAQDGIKGFDIFLQR